MVQVQYGTIGTGAAPTRREGSTKRVIVTGVASLIVIAVVAASSYHNASATLLEGGAEKLRKAVETNPELMKKLNAVHEQWFRSPPDPARETKTEKN